MTQARKFSGIVSSLVFFVLSVVVFAQRQNIYDWWRLRDYQPSQRIVELAQNTTMNDMGRKLFYVHDPTLSDKATFRSNCEIDEASIVLGCYISNHRIYVLDVDDERLKGIHEVTAAHEMLHAAYDRLSSEEQKRVDGLTQSLFASMSNERLKAVVQRYKDRDPLIVPNELHSILATEVRELTPELESYYSRYFTDRQKIVGFSEQYEREFTARNEKVAVYDAQLAALKQQTETLTNRLEAQSGEIEQERARIDRLLREEQYEAYNAAIPGFNALVRSYNANLNATRQRIDEYNSIVALRNAIAIEEQELLEAIDTRVAPQAEE